MPNQIDPSDDPRRADQSLIRDIVAELNGTEGVWPVEIIESFEGSNLIHVRVCCENWRVAGEQSRKECVRQAYARSNRFISVETAIISICELS